MSMMVRLEVSLGDRQIDHKVLTHGTLKIGRVPSSQLRLEDTAVAKMHAVVEVAEHEARLIDLGSRSGTHVNGEKVDKHRALADGDVVEIGPYRITARLEYRRGFAVDVGDVERQDGTSVVEVYACYGSTILDAQHVGQVRRGDRYTIGEGHDVDFTTLGEGLPDPSAFVLVTSLAEGRHALRFTTRMQGHVTVEGQTASLRTLVERGQALPEGGETFVIPLEIGTYGRVEHHGAAFALRAVHPGQPIARRGAADRPFWLYNAASLVGIGTFLVLAHFIPPGTSELELGAPIAENRFVRFMHSPDEVPDPPAEDAQGVMASGGEPGQRHRGEEGSQGRPAASEAPRRYALAGPKDAPAQLARNYDPDVLVRQSSMLGLIRTHGDSFLASPFGAAFAMDNDDEDVWGQMTGPEVGESFGAIGLGLAGVGRGGGGIGEGTIGLGDVGLIGHGRGGSGDDGLGRGSGGRGRTAAFGGREKRQPVVHATRLTARGALDQSVIRRVVRAHINEVRHCYNQGLVRDPNLRGRVAVQFTIGPSGNVPVAVVQQSSVPDVDVGNCVAKAVRRWRFPKPDGGGNVVVTYPFSLSPG